MLLLSVGELNTNKNHVVVIRALATMNRRDIHYVIAGRGELMEQHKRLIAELGMQDNIHLLGYCNDVDRWYKAADIFIFPSFREGLSVSLMEAMASGLPCIVSRIRGNTDLIDPEGGILFDPHRVEAIRESILSILARDRMAMGRHNAAKIRRYELSAVLNQMQSVYRLC